MLFNSIEYSNHSKGTKVFKRGLTSGITCGLIDKFDEKSGGFAIVSEDINESFSKPGDSGSLVFALDEEFGWYPIALHYSAGINNEEPVSFALPLKTIFEDLKMKNNLQKLTVSFENPPCGFLTF